MLVIILALSACAYGVISTCVLESVEVVGTSMVPTLRENGRYLLNRWEFNEREPARRDVVVIRDPVDHGFSVKRIIAVAGDVVIFQNGRVYVNGKPLREPYLVPGTRTEPNSSNAVYSIKCGRDEYFVLGDNRSASIDSRVYGPVSREGILGLVMVH